MSTRVKTKPDPSAASTKVSRFSSTCATGRFPNRVSKSGRVWGGEPVYNKPSARMRNEGYSTWFEHRYCTVRYNNNYLWYNNHIYGLSVCMCLICRLTHWNHKSKIPTDSWQCGNDLKKVICVKTFLSKVMAFPPTKQASLLVLKPIATFSLHRQRACGRQRGTDS